MLFRQHGARLVHRYHVYADNLHHQSLRGSFLAKLSCFTLQAFVEARLAAKRSRDSSSESAPSLRRHAHRTPDSAPPARKSARATVTVTVCYRCLVWCSRSDPGSAPSSDPGRQCPVGACWWPVVSGPALGLPCRCLSMLCRRLVRHRFLSCRKLLSLLLSVLLLCLGPARCPPPLIGSRLTLTLCYSRRRVLMMWCPRLCRQSWTVLHLSIYLCHSTRNFHRSCCHRIGFASIFMGPRRTSTPGRMLHPFRMVTCLRSRRPCLGDRHQLDQSDLQILTPPLAPHPQVIQLNTDSSLLVQLATAYREWLPQPPPDPAPVLGLSLFHEGPFDAASCP